MKRLQESRTALGSQAILTLIVEDGFDTAPLFDDLWREIAEFEHRFSRFIADSELSRFNANAGQEMRVSRQFRDMLLACQELGAETVGLFNPFILPGLQKAGYVGSWPAPQNFNAAQDYRGRRVVPLDELKITETRAMIPAGTALDFGGIGKGYLLDLLSDELQNAGHNDYWLSLGGDIICSGRDLDGKPWAVGVQHATRSGETIGEIVNEDGGRLAIATSGVTKRKGTNWHHIIDPRNGLPASTDLLTVTVTAADATRADVYAKCAVILGSAKATEFLAAHDAGQPYLQTEKEKVL